MGPCLARLSVGLEIQWGFKVRHKGRGSVNKATYWYRLNAGGPCRWPFEWHTEMVDPFPRAWQGRCYYK